MNCTLGSLAWLSKLAIVITDLAFIGLICLWDNLLHSWIAPLVLPFIWALMQSLLLDHLAISLDLSAISGLLHYWEKLSSNRRLMEKLWCWRSKNRSNCVQWAILLSLHSRFCQWDDKRELSPHAYPPDAENCW